MNLKGFLMHRKTAKIISVIMSVLLVITMAGCFEDTEYYLESTSSSRPVLELPTTSSSSTSTTASYVAKTFDMNRYPYYAMLSPKEMQVYSLIYEELTLGNKQIECVVEIDADQLTKAVDAVLNDHPELFWLENNYGYTYDPFDGSVKEINFNFFDFADTPEKLQEAKDKFESEVEIIVSKAFSYSTLAERELYIHDYICDNTVYDDTAPYNQSAYSVIVLHRSVCAGYSRSFQYLMQKAGYTSYYVTGQTMDIDNRALGGSGEDGAHSWNMVLLEGEFYNVDCLWDDTASDVYGSSIYPFFNVTDEALLHHERIQMALNLPVCTATEYKYSNQFGPTIESDSIIFTDAA